jgi:2-oxoisovalerate dehydrogenase E2 component (dihydrolipoyl transacylase)
MARVSMRLPDIGEGITEVELTEWNVKPGDLVREDDVLASVMTDKATVEIPSPFAGRVVELACAEGQMLAVGADLVWIETAADTGADTGVDVGAKEAPAPQVAAPVPAAAGPAGARLAAEPLAAPAIRAEARARGIDLGRVQGSGPGGRITMADLDRHQPADTPPEVQEVPVIGLRRKIAERLSATWARIPHITIVEEVDVTALEALRAGLNETRAADQRLTPLSFVMAAICRAVSSHPGLNAQYDDSAGVIRRFGPVHLGMATATPSGLIVPVLRDAGRLSVQALGRAAADLAARTRAGQLGPEALTGSTITVTSLGPLGGVATTPILNAPEVAIVGVNRIITRPMWDGQAFVPRQMMNLSASFDHRVIDGFEAAEFVQAVRRALEDPASLPFDPRLPDDKPLPVA